MLFSAKADTEETSSKLFIPMRNEIIQLECPMPTLFVGRLFSFNRRKHCQFAQDAKVQQVKPLTGISNMRIFIENRLCIKICIKECYCERIFGILIALLEFSNLLFSKPIFVLNKTKELNLWWKWPVLCIHFRLGGKNMAVEK